VTVASRLLVLVALTSPALADTNPNAAVADEAFKQGRELLKAGKWVEACEQFDKSQRLDPQLGTLFNIGQCSEHIDHLATAVAAYRELVAKDTNDARKTAAKERVATLEPRVPKLLVRVTKPVVGVTVSLESKSGSRDIAANQPVEIDFGDYSVTVRARGHRELISRIKIGEERKTTTIEAALEPADTGEREHAPSSTRKLVAIGTLGVGGAALVTGAVFGVLAATQWNQAKDICGGRTCLSQADVDRANELGARARTKATLSTAFVIGGAVVTGVGLYLYLTLPGEVRVSPQASDSSAGVTLSGAF